MTHGGVSEPDNSGEVYICFKMDEKYGENEKAGYRYSQLT